MLRFSLPLFFSLLFFSCSDDSVSVIEEESNEDSPIITEDTEGPEIGLKFFGEDSQYDHGHYLQVSDNGYLGFETINGTPDSSEDDIAVRKLTTELELIDETVVELDGGVQLWQVLPFEDDTYLLVGTRIVGDNRFPYLQKTNANGDILNTKLFAGFVETVGFNGYVSSVSVSDSVIYVSIHFWGKETAIVALDFNFEEIWHRVFNQSYNPRVFYSNDSLFYNNTTDGTNSSKKMNLYSIEREDGSTIWTKQYDNLNNSIPSIFSVYDITERNDNIYLVGEIGREESSVVGNVPQGIMMILNRENGEFVNQLLLEDYWVIREITFSGDDIIVGGQSIQTELSISRMDMQGNVKWNYKYGPFRNSNLGHIQLINESKLAFIGTKQSTNLNIGRNSVYGILDVFSGELQ